MEGKKKCVSLQPVSEKAGVFLQRNGKFIDNNERENEVKKQKRRADGGCLGFRRRRRTRQAAKMHGEPQAGTDPCVSEWGNPAGRSPVTGESRGERGELKHLSTRRRRKKTIDCRSSGERTGKSPNRSCRGSVGVVGAAIGSS